MKVSFLLFFLSIRTGQKKIAWNPHDHSFHPFFHFLLPLVQYNQLTKQLSTHQGNFFFFFWDSQKNLPWKIWEGEKFPRKLRGCLVYVFKQQFSVFKQHFTYFKALFHPHVLPQIFLNNNFQFLNTHTKRALHYFGVGFMC